MKIIELSLEPLRVPFRVSFKHASAERSETQSVLVIARSQSGLTGYGEACPRAYVTGETDASVAAFFAQHRADLMAMVTDLATLQDWRRAHEGSIDANPAAWCALELALLDLLARQQNRSVEALLEKPPLAGPFCYSAVLGDTGAQAFGAQVKQYRLLGLKDYKLKLSGKMPKDRERIQMLRDAGGDVQIRGDANNLWHHADAAIEHLRSLGPALCAVEEPLCPGDYDGMNEIAATLGLDIILDESFTRAEHFRHILDPTHWLINIRVSKMGGLLRALEIAREAQRRSIRLVIGAQVGETSLLTRAALIVAQAARSGVRAQEGAFSTLLLHHDPFQPNLQFGVAGMLDLGLPREESGFGLIYVPAVF